jgi:hypothetical protein
MQNKKEALTVNVNISVYEVDRLIVERLITIRNSDVYKNSDGYSIDDTLRLFLTPSEFERYVINGEQIKSI